MRNLKKFNEFISESRGLEYLRSLGLVGYNEKFFNQLEQLLELCPNLKEVRYPESERSNLTLVAKKKEVDDLYNLTLWMNVKDEISDEDLRAYRKMREQRRYDKSIDFIEEVAKKIYGEQEVQVIKAGIAGEAENVFKEELHTLVNHLKSIDQRSKVELYIWDVYQGFNKDVRARIPYNMKRGNKYDMDELINFIQENPGVGENIHNISIGLNSEKQEEFSRQMAAGEFGSLD